ncbi:MAG: GreA/GreB family elongation factor [Candidatus Shapirobacteria bacterium]|nr:GreA/GreB family elongation factor [Candidatus Shapirobacteria bacterium]MDD4410824.1 GreA/GreB family elongation factor [Candidatus Shapirobacteria bacterium]
MITKLGKENLEKEIKSLQKELERTYKQRNEAAAEGDLKENSAYIFMGERATVLNSQISEAIDDLKQAVIQSAPTQSDVISFGHQVSICFEEDQRTMVITLVGKNDARLKPDWISIKSPIGEALIGKKKFDKVSVNDQIITITDISIGEI